MLSSDQQARERRLSLGLGLRSGLLIGLALALGAWGLQVITLSTAHVRLLYPPLICGVLLLLLLGGLGGGLTAWLGNTLAGGLIWGGVAVLMSLVIAHVPYEGHNLMVWLADRRFWGLPVYPFTAAGQYHFWLSSFFVVLLLAILGLLQDYRLEGLRAEVSPQGRLSARGWFSLALPLPLVLAAGLIADNIINSPLRVAPRLVHEAIRTGRTYPGDLFELSLERGVNYNAIKGVRDQMSERYSLLIGQVDSAAQTIFIVAHFDNGAWINCRVVAGTLSHCYDAGLPYMQGFPALLTRGETPPDCPACTIRVSDELRAWLLARAESFAEPPRVTRLAQWGSYVLMRVEPSSTGDRAIECRFHGISPVKLEDCWEVEAPPTEEGAVGDPLDPTGKTPGAAVPATTPHSLAPRPSSLDLYAPAMRPAFVDDLATVGPVSQYRIEVTVDAPTGAEQARVSGREMIRYVNTTPVSQEAIYLRLFPNLPGYGGEMTVNNLYVGDKAVQGKLETRGTALRVPLTTPLPPGGEAVITADFDVMVPRTAGEGYGQFIYEQDVMALANFFPLIPAYDEENCARFGHCAAGWNIEYAVPYGDAVFSETALFEVFVTAPEGWTVVASGSTTAQETASDGRVTWHIVSGPMRDFNVVLSPRFEVATQKVEDILVNSYYLPEDAIGGRRVLRWVVDALTFFNEQFGPYPFAEFDVVATPTVAGGIEYPGLIVLPIHNYEQTGGPFQWSTVHEVAHQWWYSLVGNDQQDEPWLDEALTQYSTALYYEFYEKWDGAVKEVFEPRYQQVTGTDEDDLISRPVAAYSEANYGPIVYAQGPLFFHALRQEVGDKAFTAILQMYFNTYRYKIASGPDLLALAEAVSEGDLSELYQEWLGE